MTWILDFSPATAARPFGIFGFDKDSLSTGVVLQIDTYPAAGKC
jgi:hypothetical protein